MPLADETPAILFSDSQDYEKEEETMKVKVKNDREFDVQVKFQEDGEEKVETIAAGAEIEVPEDQAEAVKQQIADAEAPEAEEAEEKKEEKENEFSDREKALADREAAVAEKEAALAKKAAEAKFDKLLSDGKVVPAQKEAKLLAKKSTYQMMKPRLLIRY